MSKTGRLAFLLTAIAALSVVGAPAQAENPSVKGCATDDDCFAILRCSNGECTLSVVDLFLHLDKYLKRITAAFGVWTYIILFLIIFCETGLVVTPVLPGDSLLFATGALTAIGALDVWWCFFLLSIAAILGDTVNYWIGHKVGPRVFSSETSRFLNKEHLNRTHAFYEKHGGKTIIIARFMPFIRTFAPFVAGIGAMTYPRFIAYNVIGGVAWISTFVFGGHFFGNIPVVKRNFTIVIFTIIFISILPGIIEFVRSRRR
jgi:membrane-associated protein